MHPRNHTLKSVGGDCGTLEFGVLLGVLLRYSFECCAEFVQSSSTAAPCSENRARFGAGLHRAPLTRSVTSVMASCCRGRKLLIPAQAPVESKMINIKQFNDAPLLNRHH